MISYHNPSLLAILNYCHYSLAIMNGWSMMANKSQPFATFGNDDEQWLMIDNDNGSKCPAMMDG